MRLLIRFRKEETPPKARYPMALILRASMVKRRRV
jgi:hypothetical protein